MATGNFKEKLQRIASQDSKWKEKADWRKANESWLEKSAAIALKVMRTLKSKGLSQKDLADKLNISAQQVSKLVKGQENLTLESISKLESVLGISLLEVPAFTDTTALPALSKKDISRYSCELVLLADHMLVAEVAASYNESEKTVEYPKSA